MAFQPGVLQRITRVKWGPSIKYMVWSRGVVVGDNTFPPGGFATFTSPAGAVSAFSFVGDLLSFPDQPLQTRKDLFNSWPYIFGLKSDEDNPAPGDPEVFTNWGVVFKVGQYILDNPGLTSVLATYQYNDGVGSGDVTENFSVSPPYTKSNLIGAGAFDFVGT